MTRLQFKDDVLDRLADRWNVAQFVSFGPGHDPRLRHARVRHGADLNRNSPETAIRSLLQRSSSGTVNVRSFTPERPKGNPFHYGIAGLDEAATLVRRLAADGLFTIVNETIDVHDGGVSGVSLAGVVEFAPGGTPRVVEEPGVLSAPGWLADRLLQAVYGTAPPSVGPQQRVEFSVHPAAVGYREQRMVVWEAEDHPAELTATLSWPNRFSRHLGDKTFGLLVADALGAPVPRTTVLARSVPPFAFGQRTSNDSPWVRTAPREFAAGRFSTVRGWTDPFALLAKEDPDGVAIGAVLVQDGVPGSFSGAARHESAEVLVEGVRGRGDRFMLGLEQPVELPPAIRENVERTYRELASTLGPLRLEWVADDATTWVVQLNQLTAGGEEKADASNVEWLDFDPLDGLDRLRELIGGALATGAGVRVTRAVGQTSHVGDLLRLSGVRAIITQQNLGSRQV